MHMLYKEVLLVVDQNVRGCTEIESAVSNYFDCLPYLILEVFI